MFTSPLISPTLAKEETSNVVPFSTKTDFISLSIKVNNFTLAFAPNVKTFLQLYF